MRSCFGKKWTTKVVKNRTSEGQQIWWIEGYIKKIIIHQIVFGENWVQEEDGKLGEFGGTTRREVGQLGIEEVVIHMQSVVVAELAQHRPSCLMATFSDEDEVQKQEA